MERLRRGIDSPIGAPARPAALVRLVSLVAAGVVLGIGTSPHPPAFARIFAHVWGVASLVMIVLLVILGDDHVIAWLGRDARSRREPGPGSGD